MSDPNQSLAVIDATDAEVLAPETAPIEFTPQQADVLDKCNFHLHVLGRKIAAREIDLVYHYVEAGWWLMQAQALFHVSHRGTRGESGLFVALAGEQDRGFRAWLEAQETPIPRNTAYRWIQGARNAGLTEESTILAIQTLRAEKRLHGQSLTALCRKPVDKADQQAQLHEVTDEEKAAERLEELREAWRRTGEFLTEHGINERTWAELPREEREGLAAILFASHREVKKSLRAKELP